MILHRVLLMVSCIMLSVTPVWAAPEGQAAASLDELLKKVEQSARQESQANKQREREFLQQKNTQQQLLAEVKRELKAEQARSNKLKAEFNNNEKKLADLEKQLHLRMGSLGELFGVVKQVAGDSKAVFDHSLVSAQLKDRQTFLKDLAQRKSIPNTRELEQLWYLLQQEIIESGKVVRFPAQVISGNGEGRAAEVTRVGIFNAVSNGKFVRYLPETGQIVELARQPSSRFTDAAQRIEDAQAGSVETVIDPSRGAILSMLIQVPGVFERVQQGKLLAYIILALAVAGLLIAVERFITLSVTQKKIVSQQNTDQADSGNPLGRVFGVHSQHPDASVEVLERKLDEAIIKELAPLERGISLIKVLAVIAPLLGLLGTVTGMIETFQSITLFGTGDPKLMAGGISQALITTVLGLCTAIPLIFMHSLVNARSKRCISILEEQSAGLIAARAEKSLA